MIKLSEMDANQKKHTTSEEHNIYQEHIKSQTYRKCFVYSGHHSGYTESNCQQIIQVLEKYCGFQCSFYKAKSIGDTLICSFKSFLGTLNLAHTKVDYIIYVIGNSKIEKNKLQFISNYYFSEDGEIYEGSESIDDLIELMEVKEKSIASDLKNKEKTIILFNKLFIFDINTCEDVIESSKNLYNNVNDYLRTNMKNTGFLYLPFTGTHELYIEGSQLTKFTSSLIDMIKSEKALYSNLTTITERMRFDLYDYFIENHFDQDDVQNKLKADDDFNFFVKDNFSKNLFSNFRILFGDCSITNFQFVNKLISENKTNNNNNNNTIITPIPTTTKTTKTTTTTTIIIKPNSIN